MTDITAQLEQVELSIEAARESIARMRAMERLIKNKDFKVLFTEGYFKDDASRLVLLLADPAMAGEKEQKSIQAEMSAIAFTRQHICTIMQLGRMAEQAIVSDTETQDELLREVEVA